MKINTRSITVAATLTALCAVTGLIPYVFFLPVMVAATTLSLGMTAFVGLAFGCISLAYSFVMPMSIVSTAFITAPYLAILPRIAAAAACYGVFALMTRIAKPQSRGGKAAVVSVSAALGSLFNTAFVVGLMLLVMPDLEYGGITAYVYAPTMLISGAIECALMAALVPPIALTLDKAVLKRDRKVRKPIAETAGNAPSQSAADRGCKTNTDKEDGNDNSI